MDRLKINIPKKYYKIAAWVMGIFILIVLVLGSYAFSQRAKLLKQAVAKAENKALNDFHVALKVTGARFKGLSAVHIDAVTAVPQNQDSLLRIEDMEIGVKIWPLIFGQVKLSEVNLNSGLVNIVLKDSTSNIDFLLKRKKKDSGSKGKLNLADLAQNLLNQVLYKIPDNMDIKAFRIKLNDNDTAKLQFDTHAGIKDGKLQSTILLNENEATWHLNGVLKPGRKQLSLQLFADGKAVELPYLNHKLKGIVRFDTLTTELKDAHFSGGNYKISGSWGFKNLAINQRRIAETDIIVPNGSIQADVLVGENFVALDSSSKVFIEKATFRPFIKYTLGKHKIYELNLRVDQQNAQNLVDAFPIGLFESLDGLKVQGEVSYALNFYLDAAQPDSVKFSSALHPHAFKITHWGKTDLQKINKPFVYTPYEYGKPMRNITIGPGNPNFTPLNEISANFKNAVLTAEDPSFFSHKGFVEESIRKSIAVNFKEKKFKRGGSTISMQLVKNVFLGRQKTLTRKVEEILIVWLIENNRLVSKSRMLEVYFNIIEMGRNVYGIGEASRYYFAKHPSELNIGESLFLTNIVPNPKIALYKFGNGGYLKPYMQPYFRFIGNIMARRGLTPPDSSAYGFHEVRLREGLRQYLLPDSVEIDTNLVADDEVSINPIKMNDENKSLFDRIFGSGKKDTTETKKVQADTVKKTAKEIRQERREQRRKDREARNNPNNK